MKFYEIKYFEGENQIIESITDINDLKTVLKNKAKDSFVQAKINSGMPLNMHNIIAKHNQKLISR